MQYKCVPAPTDTTLYNKGTHTDAINAMTDFLNNQATNGWTFHSMRQFTVTQEPGCFAALILRKKPIITYYDLAIFAKE
ncbi:MAG: hypothetical protein LBC52_03815 [Treponema sp.]|jgi:hypothetical protein|nr:hypothetical protein [Treponema sp.]